jgi:hypothetical protein
MGGQFSMARDNPTCWTFVGDGQGIGTYFPKRMEDFTMCCYGRPRARRDDEPEVYLPPTAEVVVPGTWARTWRSWLFLVGGPPLATLKYIIGLEDEMAWSRLASEIDGEPRASRRHGI